jgi:phosphoglycerate dehydrogenase-like enzyme
MKLLLAAGEGESYFHLLDDVPGLEIVRASSLAEILDRIGAVDVFYGFPSAEIIAAAPQLRWIQTPSAGVEFVARIPALVESDITVTSTRGAHAPSVAEHVFALLLALTRGIPTCLDWQRSRYWGNAEGYRMLHEISGSTMGIVGFGQLGRGVAQRARAFDLDLLAVDAQAVDGQPYLDEVWPPSRLYELLARSDAVVITAPYTAETYHLIDAAALAAMRPSAYLIAVSRGGIVDEDALTAALTSGRLAGAALDVAEHEPLPPDSPLWELPNVIITPHLAGASAAKERRCVEILRENLIRFASGEALLNVVDKRRGY